MTILLITSLLVIAVITVIYLGARFHGPYLVRKLLPGCSVKSVSLRSIRGIRIDRGAHVIEIGRIGLSFGRRPNTSSSFAFRCSIQTTDVTCRSFEKESPRAAPLKLKKPPPPRDANTLRSRRSRFSIQNFALFTNSTNDTVAPPLTVVKQIAPSLARHLDGLLRPVFRILFVAAFRAVIRIVPVLMQAVDFELNRATLTLPRADDLTVLIEHVRLSTRVEFSDLELVVDDTTPEDADVSALRRLTRMGNWQLRLRGSWDRTWHRAWGRTSIIPGASIEIGHVEGTLRPRPAANGAISGTIAEPAAVSVFKIEGPSRLESSVKFIPGRATFERQSLDLEVALGQLSVDIDNALNSARRVSEVLAPKGTGLVRSPIPEDTISEEPLSPTSPISPILSAGSRARILIYRRRFQERAKKRGTLKFPEVFKNFDFRLPRFECTTSSSAGASAVDLPDRLHFIIKDIFAKGGISNPESHDMHRKWLGKSMTQEKGEALALESGFGTTTLGWMAPTGKTVVPLLTLDQFVLRALNTSWIPATRLDPNQCLLVVEATLAPLVVSGTMKDLRALEALSKRFASPSAPKPASASSPIMHIPRLIVDIHTGGFNMLFCLDNHGPQAASLAGVHLRVPQFELHGYSEFIHRPYVRRDQSREPYTESIHLVDAPYLLQFGVTGFIGPADLQIIFEDRVSAAQSGRHSMIRLAEVELRAKGDVLAAMPDTTQIPSVDRTALISRVQCASDSLVVDITNPVAISVLPDMLSVLPDREPPPVVVTRKKKPLLGILPAGVNAHFAIGTISCLASGRDLAPGNTKPVKRGIELRIGVALGYSLMHDRQHGFRTRGERHIATQQRDHLQLPADILCESTAISQQLNDAAGEKGAVVRLDAFNFQIRPIVDFANAFIPLCDWENKSTTVPTALLNIPQIRVDVLLKRSAVAHSTLHHDVCRVVADVRQIKLNLSLHHIYCIAVASTALPRLETKRAPRVEPQPRPSTDHDLTTHAVMNINNVQVRVDLPGTQKVYLCIEKTKVALRDPHREVSFGVLHGWALAADGRWDEVLRMRHLEVLAPTPETSHIAINGQGARLRIPHGFSFASLIQEISLMAKSSKHLFHIVKVGHFVAMGTPEAEGAKHVPPLVISINALVIEAADDPFETKLSLLWRAGSKEQQERMVREDAFKAKVEAIQVEVGDEPNSIASATGPHEWHFGGKHTIPIDEAYQRLQQFNSSAWISAYNTAKMAISKREETQLRQVGQIPGALNLDKPVPLDIRPIETVPPLIRLVFDGVRIDLVEPSFSGSSLPEFLKRTGDLPLDTQYTLLVPINLRWEMRYAMVTLRDYPLPLLHVRPNSDQSPSWTAFADIVIAEEIGPSDSVEWLPSTVVPEGLGFDEQPGFSLLVPKTGMPVKTYASPIVQVTSSYATDISWGVSYQPCVADVVRILDSLSHPSRDPSTPLGFWDKIRLSLHGKLRISFTAGLNLLVKGSRDPYEISGNGAGFALCWTGHPGIFVGYHLEEEKELVQFRGDRMVVGIPNLPSFAEPHSSSVEASSRPTSGGHAATLSQSGSQRPHMQKICAKLTNGVKLGLGFVLERNCGPDCTADHSLGACRKFDFRPHYSVKLRPSTGDPKIDSFAGFRSDYIHFSLSLISPMNASPSKAGYSSFHLSPKAFAHFFSWWYVFNPPNGPMLLPIRQGSLYPSDKPPPLKFTRHLVTIKYRFSLSPLFISHVYRQDSRASWATGITPCVGIKAVIESFKVDLHQRDQVETIRDEVTGRTKTKTHKPFYAVEVIAQGLDLRAMVAQFKEPEKPVVELPPPPNGETQTSSSARPPLPDSSRERLTSRWVDLDDFVETDWAPTDDRPGIWLFTAASCPRITYFKKPERLPAQDAAHTTCAPPHKEVVSRFGNEDSHVCLMGSELSAIQVQAMMCHQRLKTLEEELSDVVSFREDTATIGTSYSNRVDKVEAEVLQSRQEALEKKIGLLREHLDKLESTEVHFAQRKMREAAWLSTGTLAKEYPAYFEVDIDWSQFDNIYQIHCPQVHLNNNTRNIILDYYYSSRNRRGFEYHLSERAVRFIREQSTAPPSKSPRTSQDSTTGPATKNRAQAAAHTIRKIFTAEGGSRDSSHLNVPQPIKCQGQGEVEPASGWKTEDIVVKKSHLCLLLNPQFTLRSTADAESILVITAAKASLQTFSILDKRFADSSVSDPINADIMKRNYGSLNGLQVFSPSRARDRTANSTPHEVPLEVLLDLRCESSDFDRLVAQTDVTLQYDKFNRLRLRNKVTSATAISAQDTDINNHLHAQNDRIILNVDKLAVSATAQNFVAIYNIVSDLLLYTDPDQRERTRQLQTFMYSYDFRDFSASAGVVSELQQRLRSLLDTQMRLAMSKGPMTDERLMTRAHIFLISEELNLIFKAIRLAQEQDENASDENKSNMRFDVFAQEISWKMLEDTNDTLAKVSVRGIEYAWHSQKDSSAANKLVITDLQALDSSPDAVFPEMLVKLDKSSSHPMITKSLFAQVEWSILAPVGGISIVNSFILDLHPVRLQIERKIGRKIMAYIFPRRAITAPNGPSASGATTPKPIGPSTPKSATMIVPGHKSRSSIGAIAGAGLGISSGVAGFPRGSIDNPSLDAGPRAPRTLRKKATSHSDLKEAAAESSPAVIGSADDTPRLEGRRPIPRSRSSHTLAADAKSSALTKGPSRGTRTLTGDKEKDPEAKDDANEMLVRASKNRSFVLVRVSGLVLALSYKRDTPISLTTVPDLDDFRFETPPFCYENETWSFEDMVEVLKKDIFKAAWAQKGALLREIFTKAKIITPRRFLPHDNRLGWTHRRKGKSSKPGAGDNELDKEKEPLDSEIDNLIEAMTSGSSAIPASRDPPSSFRRPQRPTARTSTSETSPIGFPGDQEPSPTPRSIASSRGSSISQTYAFPVSGEPSGRASSMDQVERSSPNTADPRPSSSAAQYFKFPSPPTSPAAASTSRPTRQRVLSLFKKGKKKELGLDDGGKPRQSLDVPDVPPLPGMGMGPRQRTISAHAKMQR